MAYMDRGDTFLYERDPEKFVLKLKEVVEEFASGISFEEFINVLQTLKDKPSHIAKKLHKDHKAYLVDEMNQDIDYMSKETELFEKYDEITKLIQESDASSTRKAWRPIAGDCRSQLDSYTKEGLIEKRRKLQEKVNKITKTQENTRQKLLIKRKDIEEQILELHQKLKNTLEFYNENIEKLEKLEPK